MKRYNSSGMLLMMLFHHDYKKYQNDFSPLTPLYVPTQKHDNIMDKNGRRKAVKFDKYVLVKISYFTYD